MLLAKFLVPGTGDAKADVNISSLAGTGGGMLANINRWRGQLKLDPVDESGLETQLVPLDASGAKAMVADLSGTNAKTGQPTRLVGVIVPIGAQTWFYKMMGDPGVVDKEKAAFLQFVQTVKYPDAP